VATTSTILARLLSAVPANERKELATKRRKDEEMMGIRMGIYQLNFHDNGK